MGWDRPKRSGFKHYLEVRFAKLTRGKLSILSYLFEGAGAFFVSTLHLYVRFAKLSLQPKAADTSAGLPI